MDDDDDPIVHEVSISGICETVRLCLTILF